MPGLRSSQFVLAAGLALITSAAAITPAQAVPRRIILLRHGEKANAYALCSVGQQRAIALRDTYLGRSASNDSLLEGQTPAAFLAITLHTQETTAPSATSWGLPVRSYGEVSTGAGKTQLMAELARATQTAAADVLENPAWDGRTVVMTWEHKHIANKDLERQNRGEQVTLRQLLNLDQVAGVPAKWPGTNYDYFWVIDYDDRNSTVPTAFEMVKQNYPAPFNSLPHNDWDTPLPSNFPASCLR